jgi:hypothetical protein
MNRIAARRFWLTNRYDIVAAVVLIIFMVSAFWAAGTCSALLRSLK